MRARLEAPVDLAGSLQGGQAFRWTRGTDGSYTGPIGRAMVRFSREGGDTIAEGASRETVDRYLRIEPADAARRARLAKDPVLAAAFAAMPGLRLLRQDPWEATVAFVASANNNVLRIEKIVRALAARYGEPIEEGHFVFPSADRIARARESTLRACGLGYRAPYLRETARLVTRGEVDLASLRGASHAEAREALTALPGVGPKVADCIALFSLDVDDAFPMDRWMLRAMHEAFGREMRPEEAVAFAHARWGRDAGLAQQYLFHAMRLASAGVGTKRLAASP